MEPHELDALRARLIQRRDELLSLGDAELEPNREDPVAKADEDTQPLNEMNQVLASRHNKQRAEELAGIADALRRIDEEPDDFGICVDCEEDIPLRRLELMPWARRCVACQQKQGGPHKSTRRRHLADYL